MVAMCVRLRTLGACDLIEAAPMTDCISNNKECMPQTDFMLLTLGKIIIFENIWKSFDILFTRNRITHTQLKTAGLRLITRNYQLCLSCPADI